MKISQKQLNSIAAALLLSADALCYALPAIGMKYLHLLLHDEIKFSEKLFRMLNDENLGFNNAEQWFITPYEIW